MRVENYPLLPASLGRPSKDDVDAEFAQGRVLLLKEPQLERSVRGEVVLRVDHGWNDLQVLREDEEEADPRLACVRWSEGVVAPKPEARSVEDFKAEGNKVRSSDSVALSCFRGQ